jgi:hypothetical protein
MEALSTDYYPAATPRLAFSSRQGRSSQSSNLFINENGLFSLWSSPLPYEVAGKSVDSIRIDPSGILGMHFSLLSKDAPTSPRMSISPTLLALPLNLNI